MSIVSRKRIVFSGHLKDLSFDFISYENIRHLRLFRHLKSRYLNCLKSPNFQPIHSQANPISTSQTQSRFHNEFVYWLRSRSKRFSG